MITGTRVAYVVYVKDEPNVTGNETDTPRRTIAPNCIEFTTNANSCVIRYAHVSGPIVRNDGTVGSRFAVISFTDSRRIEPPQFVRDIAESLGLVWPEESAEALDRVAADGKGRS